MNQQPFGSFDPPARPRGFWRRWGGEGGLVSRARAGLGAWWRSRDLRHLVYGLPALVVGLNVAALAAAAAFAPKDRLAARYQQEANRALQAKDYATARACYERLAQLVGDRPDVRYGMGLAAEGLGDSYRAQTLLAGLAPLDRQGHGPAHLREAQRLLTKAKRSPQDVRDAEVHLRRVLQARSGDQEAHALLGQLYWATKQWDKAEKHLSEVVDARPGMRLLLARVHKEQEGKGALARAQAERAASFFRTQAETDVDDHGSRLGWAAALMVLEDYPGAVRVLQAGLRLPQAELYRPPLASVFAAWAEARERAKAEPGERLLLLEQGLRYNPGNEVLLQKLLAMSLGRSAEADKAREALQNLLAQGKASATLHALLGMDAWERGKHDEARRHYEQAYRLDPRMVVVANNLAWALAHEDSPDLGRALGLIDSALKQSPEQPYFRGTRGYILGKMGRWKEALVDLQVALRGAPKDRRVHRALAEAYQQEGLPELAEKHRRLAATASP